MTRRSLFATLIATGIAVVTALVLWLNRGYPLIKAYVEIDINSGRVRHRRQYMGLWETSRTEKTVIADLLAGKIADRPARWHVMAGPPIGLFMDPVDQHVFGSVGGQVDLLEDLWVIWEDPAVKNLPEVKEKMASDLLALWQADLSCDASWQYVTRLVEEGSSHRDRVIPMVLATKVCEQRPVGQGYETVLRYHDGTIMEIRDGPVGTRGDSTRRFRETKERMDFVSEALQSASVSGKWLAPEGARGAGPAPPRPLVLPPDAASALKEPYRDGASVVTGKDDRREMLDAWGNAVLYLPPSGSSEKGSGSIVSLGPDGKWEGGRGDDLVMSISERPRLLPPPPKESGAGNP